MATIREHGKGFQIRVSCGYDIHGKQIVQTKTWIPPDAMTKKQIEKELNRQVVLFEEACKVGQITANVKFEVFAEQWFQEYANMNLRPTTISGMKQASSRVYEAIGHLRLDKITGRHIQRFVNEMATNCKNQRNGKPLSRKTIVNHFSFISDVFGYAVKMGMLSHNPCTNVTVPKGQKEEKKIYSIEEVEQILKLLEAEPLKYRTFFTLAIYSGFRRGELLGLEWKDIDWENNIISIRRTSNYTADKGTYTGEPKTKKSQRMSKFPAFVMDLLKVFKEEQGKERKKIGSKWIDHDRLFVKWNGEPMNNNTPYFWLDEFCEKHGLPFYGLHSFRHFYASALINVGVDAATVSGSLGHSTISTTLNVYSHQFQNAHVRAGEAIASALDFSKRKNQES